MRIAYMLTSLGIGGAERQVIAIAERMAARGHNIVLIVIRKSQPHECPTSLQVIHLGMSSAPLQFLAGLRRARRILRSFQPDLVHSHTFPANMIARILHLLGAAPAVLSTIHNVYEGGRRRTLSYRVTDRLSRHTTAVSQAVADHHIKNGAVPRRRCSVITNGIDVNLFSSDRFAIALTQKLPNANHGFVWFAAGRIVPAKDYPNLLRAFAVVSASKPEANLWIAGAGTEQGIQSLQSLAAELRIQSRVHWLGMRPDMVRLFSAADAFVLSSAWEGMPLVVGEAMAMEKPVVATDVGGVRELLGKNGLIIPPKDPKTLAEAMLRLMRTPLEKRIAMGKQARHRICTYFNIDTKIEQWDAMYTRIVAVRKPATKALRDDLANEI